MNSASYELVRVSGTPSILGQAPDFRVMVPTPGPLYVDHNGGVRECTETPGSR
jgi:hypothetical protein